MLRNGRFRFSTLIKLTYLLRQVGHYSFVKNVRWIVLFLYSHILIMRIVFIVTYLKRRFTMLALTLPETTDVYFTELNERMAFVMFSKPLLSINEITVDPLIAAGFQ